jgi:transposase
MARLYAGLDVSDKTTHICIVDAKGALIHEAEVESAPAAIAQELKPYRPLLDRVGQEAGSLSQWLHKELTRRRLPMVCMDARAVHGVLSLQRAQTDINDARGLAQALRADWYARAHIRGDEAQRLRFLLVQRSALKRKAIDLEHLLRMSVKPLGARISAHRGKIAVKKPNGREDRELMRLSRNLLQAREALLCEYDKLHETLLTKAKNDPVCRRLMTVPGVGPITALAYRAGVDDPLRFHSSRSVGAYFGLTPKRLQSGESDYSGHISRLGDKLVRSALYEAAFCMIATSKSECALRLWALRLRRERGFRIACVALARKLAVQLHKIWVSGCDFDADAGLSGSQNQGPETIPTQPLPGADLAAKRRSLRQSVQGTNRRRGKAFIPLPEPRGELPG